MEAKRKTSAGRRKESTNVKMCQFRLSRLMKRKKNGTDSKRPIRHCQACPYVHNQSIRGKAKEREARIFEKITSPKFPKFNENHEATHPKNSSYEKFRGPHRHTRDKLSKPKCKDKKR